jgi:AcrR family transcriptional regulator
MDNKKWIRIAALEKESGIPRRTIHFYLQKDLLHPPMKTGKTMAYYDESHIKELRLIKSLREEGFPIAAIREHMKKTTASVYTPKHLKKNPLPQRKGAGKTRERILDIGCRLFRSKGYNQTNVSDITTTMGVGKGTFYFYFSDKKALFLECIPRIFNELFATGWERIKKIDDAKNRLETRAQMVLPVLGEFCAILRLSKEAMEESDIKIQALGERTYRSIRRPIASDIEKGIQQGIFRKTDARVAASVFIGIMESLNDLRLFDNQPLSPTIWDTVSTLILGGLLPDSD